MMKKTIISGLAVTALLLSGCRWPQSNRAIETKIQRLQAEMNGDIDHDRALMMQQGGLRLELLDRGYLERYRVLIDVKGFSDEWKDIHLKLEAFVNTRTCKAVYVEIGPSSVERDYRMMLVIWDRASSMPEWDAFLGTLSTNQAGEEVEITINPILEDKANRN